MLKSLAYIKEIYKEIYQPMNTNQSSSTSSTTTSLVPRDIVIDDSKDVNNLNQIMQRSGTISAKVLQQAIYNKMIHNQTFDRVQTIKSNPIIQQAMKDDYVKFTKFLNHMK
jgi:hypothetical protein